MEEYIISEKALEDLNTIWIYTAENWSVEQANRHYNLIVDEIEYGSEHFEMAKNFENVRKNYKYSKVKLHLVFHNKTLNTEMDFVRILHERMDIKNRIND